MNHSNFIQMQDVTLRYGRKEVLQGLTLSLSAGKCLGLLGGNGTGKTSTIKSVLGILKATGGSVSVLGGRPGSIDGFRSIGFVPETGFFPEFLTSQECLNFAADVKKVPRAERKEQVSRLIDFFEISPDIKLRDLSKGMRRRVVIAQAFLNNPKILILDEPLNALDPLIIIKLRQRLSDFLSKGGGILYASHILAEVEKICTDVVFMKRGRAITMKPVGELVAEFGSIEAAYLSQMKAGQT